MSSITGSAQWQTGLLFQYSPSVPSPVPATSQNDAGDVGVDPRLLSLHQIEVPISKPLDSDSEDDGDGDDDDEQDDTAFTLPASQTRSGRSKKENIAKRLAQDARRKKTEEIQKSWKKHVKQKQIARVQKGTAQYPIYVDMEGDVSAIQSLLLCTLN